MVDSILCCIVIQGDRRIVHVASVLARPRASQPHQAYVPKATRGSRADDRKVLSGIIHVIRNGLRWRDAPPDDGPHKTLYNRWARWSQMGVFARILTELAAQGDATGTLMIDATHLKTHRTASSMGLKKRGAWPSDWPHQGWAVLQTACRYRCVGSSNPTIPDCGERQRLHRRTGASTFTARGELDVSGSRL